MAKQTRAQRTTSSTEADSAISSSPSSTTKQTTASSAPQKTGGPVIFILSRTPGIKNNYYNWTRSRQVIVAILLYLVFLPVLPLAIGIFMYLHDPEGFKKSKALPILGAIALAQLSAFGFVASSKPNIPSSQNSATQSSVQNDKAGDLNSSATTQEEKNKIKSQNTSNPTNGRQFANCTEAFKAGVFNIKRSDAAYSTSLDRDSDGIACEK
ncbi:MAG: excalibur calcium-binding domain-containing protein [Patescibacteria group bacterium]|nr:excalibur calcium-binding domain-containing protein [Patescibacteria group bacterium]